MANIVDDVDNIKRFMISMNNFASAFTQGKNYGPSSRGSLKSSTPSTAPSPAFVATVMDPTDQHRPGSPPALTPLESSQVPKRHPQETISSWEVAPQETGSPVTPQRSLPNGGQLHHSGEWSNENSPPDRIQTKNVQSLKVGPVINKQLLSPQLIGRIAPPPTPETVAHDGPSNGHNIEDLLRYHVSQRLESKAEPVGLGESIYASHRPSHLTRTPPSARPKLGTIDDEASPRIIKPTHQVSNERRRERDLSYERLSFSIASSTPVMAPVVKITPSSGNDPNERLRMASRAVSGSDAVACVPPNLQFKTQSQAPGNATMSEPKMQDQTQTQTPVQSENSSTPVVKGIQAGLAALRAKYGGRSSSAPQKAEEEPTAQQTLDKSKEQTSEIRDASSTTSNDSHKPTHLKLDPQTYGIEATATPPLTSNFAPAGTSNNLSRPGAAGAIKFGTSSGTDQAQVVATTTGNLVTPSSANFAMISPSTGRHVEASLASSVATIAEEGVPIFFGRYPKPEGREAPGTGRTAPKSADGSAIFFGSFPEPEGRGRPAARVRKAVLSNMPFKCTAKTVASLVYGGPLESIIMKPNSCAEVLFIDADECSKFCNDNSNGLVYGKGKNDYVLVDPHTEVDIVGGKLSQMIELGVTRCVLVIGEDLDFTMEDLWELAQDKNRKVESIDDSTTPKGYRIITFKFCKMEDANNFKGVLQRDPEWEHCNIRFAPDPCTTATGPRFKAEP